MRAGLIVFAFLLGTFSEIVFGVDSCQSQIPKSLEVAVRVNFSGYRTPFETDNSPADVQFNKSNNGTGCLGVAVADFDGDKKTDYLLGLTAIKGKNGLAVIALSKASGWRFYKIRSWAEDARERQYVEIVKPGIYKRTESLDVALERGERNAMRCLSYGALVGSVESTGVVYCKAKDKWFHVWVSD